MTKNSTQQETIKDSEKNYVKLTKRNAWSDLTRLEGLNMEKLPFKSSNTWKGWIRR